MALCKLNSVNMTVEYAGAYNPLVHVRKRKLSLVKGDKQPIAYYTGIKKPFTNKLIKLQKGDMLYIYSDGFSDQFGGENGKKYMVRKFKKFLTTISDLSADHQN